MPPKLSRLVAAVASLSLACCSTIGSINGQRIEAGPAHTMPAPDRGYLCEDFEFLCVVAVGAIIGGVIVATKVKSVGNN